MAATVPVPPGLALVADSVSPAGALASTDGTMGKEPVALGEYRALRWSIAQLGAGDRTTVRLRARALTTLPAK